MESSTEPRLSEDARRVLGLDRTSTSEAHKPYTALGLSEAAASVVAAGRPVGTPPPSSEAAPAAHVERPVEQWTAIRQAARRLGARPASGDEWLSTDEAGFHRLVAAREARGLSFREALAAAEAAIRSHEPAREPVSPPRPRREALREVRK